MKSFSLFVRAPAPKTRQTLPFLLGVFALGTTLCPDPAAAATGVEFMGIAKLEHYVQTSSEAPVTNPERPFATDIFLDAESGQSVSAVQLSFPDQKIVHLEHEEAGSPFWGMSDEFPNRADRDSAYPDGTYTFTISTANSGNRQVSLNLTGNAFPTPPRIRNFAQAQAIDETKPFTLSWDAFAESDGDDFIILGIEDPARDDEEIFHSGFLPATATSIDLPARLLQPARNYYVYLIFANIVDTDEQTFSGGKAIAGYFSETSFEIRTPSPSEAAVEAFGVVKLNRYFQFNENAPQPTNDESAFEVEIFVNASETEAVSGATVLAPNGSSFPLESDGTWNNFWNTLESFSEASEREFLFPNGTYQFQIQTADDLKTIPLELTGNNYPSAPRIRNHAAAQSIDASANLTLSWNAFSGAGADDFIVMGIEDPMDDYEAVFESDFLPATSTSVEVPAGTLKPGRFYEVWVAFAKVSDKNETAFPGTGFAAYLSETKFSIRTNALPGPGTGVDRLGVIKVAFFEQTSSDAPTLVTEENPFEFFAFTETTGSQQKQVLLMPPSGKLYALEQEGDNWEHSQYFANHSELDSSYASGIYTFNIGDLEGGKFVSLNFGGNAYPQPLQLENFDALQNIDVSQPFTLSWSLPPGTGANDQIVVGIENETTGDIVYDSAFLPGTTASLELPAGTFELETDYRIRLTLIHVVDNDATVFPQAHAFGGYAAESYLHIRTSEPGLSYENWSQQLSADERTELDDAGNRGIRNLLRFAFGMDALQPERENLPQLGTITSDGEPGRDHLSLTFAWRKNLTGISFVVETSTDLVHWTELDAQIFVTDSGDGITETVTVVDPAPVSDFGTRFLRVRVSR